MDSVIQSLSLCKCQSRRNNGHFSQTDSLSQSLPVIQSLILCKAGHLDLRWTLSASLKDMDTSLKQTALRVDPSVLQGFIFTLFMTDTSLKTDTSGCTRRCSSVVSKKDASGFINLPPVVQTLDNAIQRKKHHPVVKYPVERFIQWLTLSTPCLNKRGLAPVADNLLNPNM